jgi:predicted permease
MQIMTTSSVGEVWVILFLVPAHVLIGYTVGIFCMRVFFRDMFANGQLSQLWRVLVSCFAFSNSGDIPISMLSTLAQTDVFATHEFANESGDARTSRSFGYIGLYALPFNLIAWTFLWNFLATSTETDALQDTSKSANLATSAEASNGTSARVRSQIKKTPAARVRAAAHFACTRLIQSPPLIATIIGIVIGIIGPLRSLFFNDDTSEEFDDAPLRVVTRMLKVIGNGTIPMSMLVLGGNLAGVWQRRQASKAAAATAAALTNPESHNQNAPQPKSIELVAPTPLPAASPEPYTSAVECKSLDAASMSSDSDTSEDFVHINRSESPMAILTPARIAPDAHALPIAVLITMIIGRLIFAASLQMMFNVLLLQFDILPRDNTLLMFVAFITCTPPTATTVVIMCDMLNVRKRDVSLIVFWQFVAALITLPLMMILILSSIDWYASPEV